MSQSITLLLSEFYEILNESSLGDLERSAVQAFPNTRRRQHTVNTVQISSAELIPEENALMVKGEARNTSEGTSYNPTIELLGVEYVDEPSGQTATFTGTDGNEYHINPLDVNRTQVKVTCTCMDFYWRFAMWNHNDGSLLGPKPDAYVRKTDTRPPANPTQSPGICKHLMRMMDYLQQQHIMR